MKNIKEIWIVLLSSWTLILTYNILASQTTEDAIWLLVWLLCILGLFIPFRKNNWKSIAKHGTPNEIVGTYLACLENGCVMEYRFSKVNSIPTWWHLSYGTENPNNKVTHWMELPKAPK